jgi:hypothetical protein
MYCGQPYYTEANPCRGRDMPPFDYIPGSEKEATHFAEREAREVDHQNTILRAYHVIMVEGRLPPLWVIVRDAAFAAAQAAKRAAFHTGNASAGKDAKEVDEKTARITDQIEALAGEVNRIRDTVTAQQTTANAAAHEELVRARKLQRLAKRDDLDDYYGGGGGGGDNDDDDDDDDNKPRELGKGHRGYLEATDVDTQNDILRRHHDANVALRLPPGWTTWRDFAFAAAEAAARAGYHAKSVLHRSDVREVEEATASIAEQIDNLEDEKNEIEDAETTRQTKENATARDALVRDRKRKRKADEDNLGDYYSDEEDAP